MSRRSLVPGALIVLTSAVLVAGCADDSGTTSPVSSSAPSSSVSSTGGPTASVHNDADVAFAQEMIPHHRQAVEMAALVASRSTDPRVLDLAARIQAAQEPEIDTMTAWLRAWGARVPPTAADHAGMGHAPDVPMPGMMNAEQMNRMEAARGAEFDRLWLTGMIEHHEGAVDMARTELDRGANAEAKALAQHIIDAQRAEITEMRGLLDG
ncbi:DUF305 domain-containing protein [Nocardia takedensis]|uniref:DUF305 domain-containing protein n=1 Tax=Nocardia takedensis TaxID=259390 RepID=UPI0002F183F3|nr:DUF305 domain-containing protein [Nocardia takedensis]